MSSIRPIAPPASNPQFGIPSQRDCVSQSSEDEVLALVDPDEDVCATDVGVLDAMLFVRGATVLLAVEVEAGELGAVVIVLPLVVEEDVAGGAVVVAGALLAYVGVYGATTVSSPLGVVSLATD